MNTRLLFFSGLACTTSSPPSAPTNISAMSTDVRQPHIVAYYTAGSLMTTFSSTGLARITRYEGLRSWHLRHSDADASSTNGTVLGSYLELDEGSAKEVSVGSIPCHDTPHTIRMLAPVKRHAHPARSPSVAMQVGARTRWPQRPGVAEKLVSARYGGQRFGLGFGIRRWGYRSDVTDIRVVDRGRAAGFKDIGENNRCGCAVSGNIERYAPSPQKVPARSTSERHESFRIAYSVISGLKESSLKGSARSTAKH
ncbi:hypothetical protein B0H14DRAFT_2648302 [Mycena olivaceomarginata]|nr:hypothetical protein B0H14DRAFT_2648302 [Mycena olivaceomarginata]